MNTLKILTISISLSILILSAGYFLEKVVDAKRMNLEATRTAVYCYTHEGLGVKTKQHCVDNAIDNYLWVNTIIED